METTGTEHGASPLGPQPLLCRPLGLLRLSAVAFVLATLWYLPWMVCPSATTTHG